MSLLSTIQAMEDAGIAPEQIIAAVKAMEARRLEGQRQRTAKCRKNKEASNDCNVTPVTDVTASPKEKPPQTPQKEIPPQKKKDPKGSQKESSPQPAKRATRLPEDWLPSPPVGDGVWKWDEEFSEEVLNDELAKFRDYWRGIGGAKGAKLDWDATWRNWLRNARNRQCGGSGSAQSLASTGARMLRGMASGGPVSERREILLGSGGRDDPWN